VVEAGGEAAVRERLKRAPDDAQASYLVACADASRGRYAEAVERLVTLVKSGPAEIREASKKAAGPIFEAAGRKDDRVEASRRRLAALLF
jgi:thioredoxin-like negative regulator of GroEL